MTLGMIFEACVDSFYRQDLYLGFLAPQKPEFLGPVQGDYTPTTPTRQPPGMRIYEPEWIRDSQHLNNSCSRALP